MSKFEKMWEFEFWWNDTMGTLSYGWFLMAIASCFILSSIGSAGTIPSDSGALVIWGLTGAGFILLPILMLVPWARRLFWTKKEKGEYESYSQEMDRTEGARRRSIEG